MFIVGDIIARYSRLKGKNVFFPIALHYSGNTAHRISKIFNNIFVKKEILTQEKKRFFSLYKEVYKLPIPVLRSFTNPLNILDFFTQEILWELNSLDVSADYVDFYTTKNADFEVFINTIFSLYEKKCLLIYNKDKELALNYDNKEWRKRTLELIERIEFIQPFHKNNILSAMKDVRNEWRCLKKTGFGVAYYKNKKYIIDPMFDSEFFMIFDLYVKFKKELKSTLIDAWKIFENLFHVLNGEEKPKNVLVEKIIQWLPCDVLICEEHLKNWVAKKLFAESALLSEKYQTKKFFILGTGLLNGKRMSAFRGNAILASDLINSYGPIKTRLIIILQGGHPSKTYNYDHTLPVQIDKLLTNFINYYTHLLLVAKKYNKKVNERKSLIKIIRETIEKYIEKGYYRQAIIELLSILPKKYKINVDISASNLIAIYKDYLGILVPSLLKGFDNIP